MQLKRITRTHKDAKEVKHTKVTPRSKQEPPCLPHFHPLAPGFLPGEEPRHEHQVGIRKHTSLIWGDPQHSS